MKIFRSRNVIIAGLIIMFAPFILITFIGWPLSLIGNCTVTESEIYPCVILGQDIGRFLYTIGVLGWSFLVTFPIGGLVVLVGITKKVFEKTTSKTN
jgi:hypothetical protein